LWSSFLCHAVAVGCGPLSSVMLLLWVVVLFPLSCCCCGLWSSFLCHAVAVGCGPLQLSCDPDNISVDAAIALCTRSCVRFVRWHTSKGRSVSAGSVRASHSSVGVAVAPDDPGWRLLFLRGAQSEGVCAHHTISHQIKSHPSEIKSHPPQIISHPPQIKSHHRMGAKLAPQRAAVAKRHRP
jgi:hypothetical protein